MILEILNRIESLQEQSPESLCFGNYISRRYHPLFPISRAEDNVYFVAWINQALRRNGHRLPTEFQSQLDRILSKGDHAIHQYRNRYGEKTYNFYRPENWFPNGVFLSKFGVFQPTDDSDDTSIALRGRIHSKEYARAIKGVFAHQSNGLRGRFLARGPRKYRKSRFYNTWVGSEGLYVDLDLVVVCNVLMFNAQYDLGLGEEDKASIKLLVETVKEGEILSEKWSLCAWYPFESVILYCISDLISTEYYSELNGIKELLIKQIAEIRPKSIVDSLLLENALMKLGDTKEKTEKIESIDEYLRNSQKFTFGVIPLLHPWNGRFMQYLSKYKLFRMFYQCDAHVLAILLENKAMKSNHWDIQ